MLIPVPFNKLRTALLALAFSAAPVVCGQQAGAPSQNETTAVLQIGGDVATQLTLTASDLKKLPRKTLKVLNPHEKKTEVYEGVPMEELLGRAGVPQGTNMRGAAMASYVVAEATDGYRVVFSLAELDPDIVGSEVIVADTEDGAPLGPKQGPFKIVAPHEKRPARWVRMLKSLTVVKVPG